MKIVYSLDPRNANICIYPFHISNEIIKAFESKESSISFPDYYDITIHFKENEWIQVTGTIRLGSSSSSIFNKYSGYRSVGIINYDKDTPSYIAYVKYISHSYYLAKEGEDVHITPTTFTIPDDYFNDRSNDIAVWHYCNTTDASDSIFTTSSWSPYNQDSNNIIETEFQKNRTGNVEIYIGCRRFMIEFNGIYGTQTDTHHGLKRAIQRKIMNKSDYDLIQVDKESKKCHSEETTCFCLDSIDLFDSILLPCCNKKVHKICMKPLANTSQPCPFCRKVNSIEKWRQIFNENVGIQIR